MADSSSGAARPGGFFPRGMGLNLHRRIEDLPDLLGAQRCCKCDAHNHNPGHRAEERELARYQCRDRLLYRVELAQAQVIKQLQSVHFSMK